MKGLELCFNIVGLLAHNVYVESKTQNSVVKRREKTQSVSRCDFIFFAGEMGSDGNGPAGKTAAVVPADGCPAPLLVRDLDGIVQDPSQRRSGYYVN